MSNDRLQEHASSQEHGAGHDAGRVALADSDGGVLGGALRSHSGRAAGLAGHGGSGHGHSAGGRSGGGGRGRRGHGSGVLASTVRSLLASLLALGIVGVSVDALAVGGLADVEGDGLDVLAGVGDGTVTARALELQSGLELELSVGFNDSERAKNVQDRRSWPRSSPCTYPGRRSAGPGTTSSGHPASPCQG